MPPIDPSFLDLPLGDVADSAIDCAEQRGATDVSVHVVRTRTADLHTFDGRVSASSDRVQAGLGVRVIHDGTMGYAATDRITTDAARAAADDAVELARRCRSLRGDPVVMAPEPVHPAVVWSSEYEIDPFSVPDDDRADAFASMSARLLESPPVEHVSVFFVAVADHRHYADAAGRRATQQRVRVHPLLTVTGVDRDGQPVSVRSSAPPTARGWEYLGGTGWDWDRELASLPDHLAHQLVARPVDPGRYDLVVAPTNLWLTLHETVGHATELDRALGHEAGYAGTTFVRPDSIGSQRIGAPCMNVTADRNEPHGLATVALDDEGVAAQSWSLVEDGVVVGMQTDRRSAAQIGADRSNGCSFAETALLGPIARMPNVSLRPAPAGPDTDELIGGVDDGIYLDGPSGFSIDTERRRFQFTAQRCRRIRNGRLAEPLRDVAYGGTTTTFWRSLAAIGGPATYGLFGADMCGKGQPVQSAAASHGCPAAAFAGVDVVRAGG